MVSLPLVLCWGSIIPVRKKKNRGQGRDSGVGDKCRDGCWALSHNRGLICGSCDDCNGSVKETKSAKGADGGREMQSQGAEVEIDRWLVDDLRVEWRRRIVDFLDATCKAAAVICRRQGKAGPFPGF